jgi:hypothetical protein
MTKVLAFIEHGQHSVEDLNMVDSQLDDIDPKLRPCCSARPKPIRSVFRLINGS